MVDPAGRWLPSYVALAGEFFVLAELALRGLDGTLTLGHTKEIDILVLNRTTEQMFRLEVKTTHKAVQHSKIFGSNLADGRATRLRAGGGSDLLLHARGGEAGTLPVLSRAIKRCRRVCPMGASVLEGAVNKTDWEGDAHANVSSASG
jgi:hypothetical protein